MARPTKEAEPGTTVTIGLRVPAELKTALEARAAANHRNLSQECERALQRSFSAEALFVDTVALLLPVDNLLAAGQHVRNMAREVYGHEIGDVGWLLMKSLAMAKMIAADGGRYRLTRQNLIKLKEALRELENSANIVDVEGRRKAHGTGTHQGTGPRRMGDKDRGGS